MLSIREQQLILKYNVDTEQFWQDDQLAHMNQCFSPDAPQIALGIRMTNKCVFAELNEPGQPWEKTPIQRQLELNKRYNDKAEVIVGRRLLQENLREPVQFPYRKNLTDIFECKQLNQSGTVWVQNSVHTPKELEALLDRVEKLDLRSYIFPENWDQAKTKIFNAYGKRPGIMRGLRGPVTLATSIYGDQNLIFLIVDHPDLAKRFSQVLSDILFQYISILDEDAGYGPDDVPHGFRFLDDNCALLSPDMYELFGYPIVKRIFEQWCPDSSDVRFQHSDSAMGHLVPILAKLNLTACNFGPTVLIDQIRKFMPNTTIHGCIHPISFMNNELNELVAQTKRDCEMAKIYGRGVSLETAGAINNGSLLTSLRVIMHTMQRYGRS